MKIRLPFLSLLLILLFGCSSDDDSDDNSFFANGKKYTTDYAYNTGNTNGVFIFSSADRYSSSYTENRGRFNLHYEGLLQPGIYSAYNGGIDGVIEFDKGIVNENGMFTSLGENIAAATNVYFQTDGFKSGKVTIRAVEHNAEGDIINVDLDYSFKWETIEIKGNYNGVVRKDP